MKHGPAGRDIITMHIPRNKPTRCAVRFDSSVWPSTLPLPCDLPRFSPIGLLVRAAE